MVKKEQIRKNSKDKTIEALNNELADKGKEIEQLQKSMAEMKAQIQEKEKTGATSEPTKSVDGLLNVGFSILGATDSAKGEKPKGLLGLVNELNKLAEKSQTNQTTQKTINFGKGGVVDFHVSSRPIRATSSLQPTSKLNIKKPSKQSPMTYTPLPPTAGTIEERELIVDVFEEEDCLRVMAELPSVKENEISLNMDGNILMINAGAAPKAYCRKVELPTAVEKKIVESTYRNGILEVKLRKIKTNAKTK